MNLRSQQHQRTVAIFMWAAALTCAALAIFISTEHWSQWFAHPAQTNPELTAQGALLWRMMLGAMALMLGVSPFVWRAFVDEARFEMPTARSGMRQVCGVLAIIVIGLLVRAMRINESLWYDEIASWMTYTGGATTIGSVIGNFFDPINHPAHTLLNHLSVKWFSDSLGVEIAFRLPALVFSLLSILAMFGLVRTVRDERAGYMAAGLAALLPISVLEGVQARGYSMVIFFAAMMTWLLIEARHRKRIWLWLAYALCCGLGVWAHFVAAFLPIGHGVWLLWRAVRFSEWRHFLCGGMALALAATLAITLYSPMIPGMLAAKGMFAATSLDQPTVLSVEGLHALLQLGGSWYWWAALPGLALFAIGLVYIVIARREAMSSAVELAMIGLPLMVIVIALGGTWIYARFTMFALPGAILLIAIGAAALWAWHRAAAMIALGVVFACSIADLTVRPAKQPLRDAAQYVRDNYHPGDRLLVIGLAHPVMRIYADDLNLTYSFKFGHDLPRQLLAARPSWIVIEYPNRVQPEVYELIKRARFKEVSRYKGWADWTQGDVVVYRRD